MSQYESLSNVFNTSLDKTKNESFFGKYDYKNEIIFFSNIKSKFNLELKT